MTDPQNLTVCLVSLGCSKNLVDSERMLADLAEAGCLVGAPMDDADIIVINTCGFLAASRTEAIEVIREAVEHKRTGRAKRVVVAGCLPTRDGEATRNHVDGIDAVLGVNDRNRIVEAALTGTPDLALSPPPAECASDAGRFRLTPPHTAYLRIAEGCDQKCSFCTIPAIRGPMRSKPTNAVLAEAAELIATGARELNIIAQDTTAWGMDFSKTSRDASSDNLAALLRRLNDLDGVEWLRLLYTYPRRFDENLISTIASCDHVLPYVDLPLQHIADGVLKRMGRGVTGRDCRNLVDALLERIDGVALRTSFIVGFPGETEEDFAELLEFVEDCEFDHIGVFEYSAEPGTRAAKLPGQLPDDVKAARAEAIMLAQQQIVFDRNDALATDRQPLEVLVDGIDAEGRCVGRYYGQAPEVDSLCIFTEPQPPGEFLNATVIDSDNYDLIVEALR